MKDFFGVHRSQCTVDNCRCVDFVSVMSQMTEAEKDELGAFVSCQKRSSLELTCRTCRNRTNALSILCDIYASASDDVCHADAIDEFMGVLLRDITSSAICQLCYLCLSVHRDTHCIVLRMFSSTRKVDTPAAITKWSRRLVASCLWEDR
eukprot:GHVQ01024305.1.p1 GENE.GHVQ01024305.1~~GHVQ01024305.1.p1  ORF type:complete len:150 (-),score=13.03 GHVQ01024305.1:2813-3262(-)